MFWEKFSELCKKNGISPNGLAKILSISSGSITSWKQGRVPHHDTLLKIANHFDVSVDYLLNDASEQKETLPAEILAGRDELDIEILNLYSQLSDEQKAQALTYLEFLKNQSSSKTQ